MFHIRNNKILSNTADCKTWGEKARAAINPHQIAEDKVKSLSKSLRVHISRLYPRGKYSNDPWEWPLPQFNPQWRVACPPLKPPLSSSVHFWSSCRLQQTLSNIKIWHQRQHSRKAVQGNTRATVKGPIREEISKPLPGIFGQGRKTRCTLWAWDQALSCHTRIYRILFRYKLFLQLTPIFPQSWTE